VRWKVVAAIVSVVLLAAAGGYDYWTHRKDGAALSRPLAGVVVATPRPGPHIPALLAITDSVSLVSNGNEPGKQYPTIVADQMGWSAAIDAVSGRGFLPGTIGPFTVEPFSSNLSQVIKQHPVVDYVIIDGGRNDVGKPQEQALKAMNEFYDSVRAAYPNAKFIVTVAVRVSPTQFLGDGSRDTYEVWAQAVHIAADRIHAHVIDPIAEHWYDGVDLTPYIWTDGIHLNAMGQKFYADKVVTDLKRFGDL
jgi:hypothetical protein